MSFGSTFSCKKVVVADGLMDDDRTQQEASAPWPYFETEEIEAVTRVLRSGKVNYWTGVEGRLFEKEFAQFVEVGYAVALANGTVALEAALHAVGISPGDEVITSCRTFIASASAIVMRGATPVLADVNPVSQNITSETISKVLTPRTKAIIAVHLAGWPCDMDPIMDLARSHGLKVIEDCAQAHGASYKGRMVGSVGDAAAFSFCQDKIMSTGGEGGMLTTNDHETWSRAWSFKEHGKCFEAVFNREHSPGFRWLHESFGTNWRMTEMQSAIGRVLLRKLPQWVEARRRYASILTKAFKKISALRTTEHPEEFGHAYYKYYVFIRPAMLKKEWDRDRIMSVITDEGVPCNSGSCSEIYLEKTFFKAGLSPAERLPVARELGETSLMLLVHPTLTVENIENTCSVVRKVMRIATKSK